MAISKANKIILITLILAIALSAQVEARRQILKGRRTLTRTYFRDSSIPAWAVVVLVALGELIVGGVLYFVLKRVILDTPVSGTYTVVQKVLHSQQIITLGQIISLTE